MKLIDTCWCPALCSRANCPQNGQRLHVMRCGIYRGWQYSGTTAELSAQQNALRLSAQRLPTFLATAGILKKLSSRNSRKLRFVQPGMGTRKAIRRAAAPGRGVRIPCRPLPTFSFVVCRVGSTCTKYYVVPNLLSNCPIHHRVRRTFACFAWMPTATPR